VSTETNQPESSPGQKAPIKLPQLPQGNHEAAARPNASPDAETVRRRRFLNWIALGAGGLSVASIFWAVVTFLLAPLDIDNKSEWRRVGKPDDFKIGSTTLVKFKDATSVAWAGYAGQTAAWLRRDTQSGFTCFSINCTHLGCPVRWEASAQLFMCPCHGGVYYSDGANAAGPPPQPLPRYKVRVRQGIVEVLASPVPITRGVG
jgi:menaquinol-cytochrome c reductase iron-sulfur subunit